MYYKYIGIAGILLTAMLFSLELYGLQLIQVIDKSSGTDFRPDPFGYFSEPCIRIAFIITIIVMICNIMLYLYGKEICTKKQQCEKEKEL
ncbi:hypothetical protein [Clostridium sp. MD294]|uniref:hypothetical protein n=1 Tax=Clostridium sp. MD294 TaxID=97138 RepID=UPI0002C9BAFD|nr:hypothetical protein [Clostridium sp. MD294]NDO46327.1 hypothetical protein [Clostridium sp. MD294]USF29246.1 hypothetical protein C820_000631 [Clostridium sp. MD294]